MTLLEIKIKDYKTTVICGGDMAALAREIGRIAFENDEFALALNLAMIPVNEEITAIRLRDEMIGIINND